MGRHINPFIIRGYENKKHFCDRQDELAALKSACLNQRDVALISARRMGKTALILRLFEELKHEEGIETLYVDISASRDLKDFIQLLAEAKLADFSGKTPIGRKFTQVLKTLKPELIYHPISGQPHVNILYHTEQQKVQTLYSLLEFLNRQNKNIIVAIDEFQQILEYPEKNMEALLRSQVQLLNNVNFIYCGSHRSKMVDIFSNVKRPFFASTQFLYLQEIDRDIYAGFIEMTFRSHGMNITAEAMKIILDWSRTHTFYTQSLCNKIFSFRKKVIDESLVKEACLDILKANEQVYYQYRQLLTPAQWNFLIAVAMEEKITQITSQGFISRYDIGTPSNARRISQSLTEKELLLEVISRKGTYLRVYDVFFSRWLQMVY